MVYTGGYPGGGYGAGGGPRPPRKAPPDPPLLRREIRRLWLQIVWHILQALAFGYLGWLALEKLLEVWR